MPAARRAGSCASCFPGPRAALGGLSAQYAALVESDELEPRETYDAFLQVLGRDAADALAAMNWFSRSAPSAPSLSTT